jgi:hypothetical protein
MHRETAASSAKPHSQSVSYPHTDFAAPYRLVVTNLKSVPTNDEGGGLVAADLVHPQLGTVGHIYDSGSGSGPKFVPASAGFGVNELQEFAERCTERGRSLGDGFTPIESLLNLLLIEHGFDALVTAMIRAGRQSLVRLIDDTEPSIRDYQEVVPWPTVLFDRRYRMRAARELVALYPNPQPGQVWELWTGTTWMPLQHDLCPADPTNTDRMAELRHARATWQASDATTPYMHSYGPLADGSYVSDYRGKSDSYQLASAPGTAQTWHWCRCKTGPRSHRVHIEHWDGSDGLVASGTIHASCRRLISMD